MSRNLALKRESAIKVMSRQDKESLIGTAHHKLASMVVKVFATFFYCDRSSAQSAPSSPQISTLQSDSHVHFSNKSSRITGVLALTLCGNLAGMWTHVPEVASTESVPRVSDASPLTN